MSLDPTIVVPVNSVPILSHEPYAVELIIFVVKLPVTVKPVHETLFMETLPATAKVPEMEALAKEVAPTTERYP